MNDQGYLIRTNKKRNFSDSIFPFSKFLIFKFYEKLDNSYDEPLDGFKV